MKSGTILSFTLLTLLVNVIAGDDIVVFNQELEDSIYENIDSLLEKEEFIQVEVDHHRKRPQAATSKIKQHQTPFNNSSSQFASMNHESEFESGSKVTQEPPAKSLYTHKLSSTTPGLNREVTLRAHVKDNITEFRLRRTQGGDGASRSQWQGIQNEDELNWMIEGDLLATEAGDVSSRQKRQAKPIDPMSGFSTIQTEFVLIGGILTTAQNTNNSPQNIAFRQDVGDALQYFLEDFFYGLQFMVDVTYIGMTSSPAVGIVVRADIIYDDNLWYDVAAAEKDLAQALYYLDWLDNFRIRQRYYEVKFPYLERSSTNVMTAAICFLCSPCSQKADQTWECRFEDSRFYKFGEAQGDRTLPSYFDDGSVQINFNPGIPYENELETTINICENGIISFGREPYTSWNPRPLPARDNAYQNKKILAVYWADLELFGQDSGAKVYYQVYTNLQYRNTPAVQEILTKANNHVRTYTYGSYFEAQTVIVITWYKMSPWPTREWDNFNERVTFQCAIISDGESTYVVYLYGLNGMGFNPYRRRPVQVGWGSTNSDYSQNNYYIFDKITGNTGQKGMWFYKIGYKPNNAAKCLAWYYSNYDPRQINFGQFGSLSRAISFWDAVVPTCPCDEFVAAISGLWFPSFEEPGCYDTIPLFGTLGRRCCYRSSLGLWSGGFWGFFENRLPRAGNLQFVSPFVSGYLHYIWDALPKQWCCYDSNLCSLYYQLRPSPSCQILQFTFAWNYGDPHMRTLDGRAFLFNGLGEYRLVEIAGTTRNNATVNFRLQGRTCQAKTSNGTLSDATVFCALVAKSTNGTTISAEINDMNEHMIIYLDGQDYSVRFRTNANFSVYIGGIIAQRMNDSLKIATPDQIGITITKRGKLLDFSVELSNDYKNLVRGLMGNFNGDKTDDFRFPNGTQLPDSSTERQLFHYAQTWAVTEADSLFNYTAGQNASTFSHPEFVPLFLEEQSTALRTEAEKVCGSATAIPCIFDYIATRDATLARGTEMVGEDFSNTEERSRNAAPRIYGQSQISATVGQPTMFTLTANDTDGGSISQWIPLDDPGRSVFTYTNPTRDSLTATFTPTSINQTSIGLVAVDNTGLQSMVTEMNITTCSGCSGNGTCDFSQLRATSNPYYSVAECVCKDPYSGQDCELDKDGCYNDPCPESTTCTDVPFREELRTGEAYKCGDCPPGYSRDANSTKCEDINECNTNGTSPCGANSTCTNTFGSYSCSCNRGFRKSKSGMCVDINECVEYQFQCVQICENTEGSYQCKCEAGWTTSGMLHENCTQLVKGEGPCKDNKCQYGCRNASGVAQCFCETGRRIAADGVSCEDIDECKENLCSQICVNSPGSYECSCYAGYTLAMDGLSCEPCEDNKYGGECNMTCNCRGRASKCDSVRGCICNSAWSGESCEVDVDECSTIPNACPSDQICTNTEGSYTCSCPDGYEMLNGSCSNINECENRVCKDNEQTCVDNPGSYTCLCKDGYNYDSVNGTCKDIDECAAGLSDCEHICDNQEGSYNCYCRLGYVLADDRRSCVKDQDPCSSFNITCSYSCDLVNGSPQCYCALGFQLAADKTSCLDIDECKDDNSCSDTCTNTQGSYNCSCPDGKELRNDMRTCKVCDDYHWGPDCANECACDPKGSVSCDPVTGCECAVGWQGTTCDEDVDECSYSQSPCDNSSRCVNTAGSFVCMCPTGFELVGGRCTDINECKTSFPCDHNCTNTVGSYSCSCFGDGFRSDGDDCIDIDECAVPALSNCDQLCRNTEGGFACECFEGYLLNLTTRNTCYRDSTVRNCASGNKCNDKDLCRIENGQEVCFCRPGYELNNVTCKDIDECINSPCINGSCTNSGGTFTCNCPAGTYLAEDKVTCQECGFGFYGRNCASPCKCSVTNTERCIPEDGRCECREGWTGADCTRDINECDPFSTVNCGGNAVCTNSPGSYRCVCTEGFFRSANECIACDATHYGQDCIKKCSCVTANTKDCNNTSGACTCKDGWSGPNCEQDVNECSVNPLYCTGQHEICHNLNGTAECRCNTGYARLNPDTECQDMNECLDPELNACVGDSRRTCNNVEGSFQCICKEGFKENNGQCEACDPIHFGLGCANMCKCNTSTTRDCDDITGDCHCKSGWTGLTCDDDLNECDENPDYCSGPHESCFNTDGLAECRCDTGYEKLEPLSECQEIEMVTPEPQNNNLAIGLGVGIPLFLLLLVAIALLVYCCMRKRSRRSGQSSAHSLERDEPFRSVFATQGGIKATRMAPGRPMYTPDAYSESGTSDSSGRGQLLKSKQRGLPDFQGSPWADNRGAAPQEPSERYAPSEVDGPSANFSWEYMFNMLEPNPFEIQRPVHEPEPNPVYLPRSRPRPGATNANSAA